MSGTSSCSAGILTPATCSKILCWTISAFRIMRVFHASAGTINAADDVGRRDPAIPCYAVPTNGCRTIISASPARPEPSTSPTTPAASRRSAAPLCARRTSVVDHACVPCQATVNAAGDDASGAEAFCGAISCDKDQRVLSNVCVDCEAGSNTAETTPRPRHVVRRRGVRLNQRVDGAGECVACPPGTTNDAGDDTLGGETQCDATYCP